MGNILDVSLLLSPSRRRRLSSSEQTDLTRRHRMFRHVVMFKWNDDVTDEHIDAMSAGLSGLIEVIPEIKDYKHGRDAGVSDQNFDYVVVGDFNSVADYETYRDHPAHREVIANLFAGRLADRSAVQYETD